MTDIKRMRELLEKVKDSKAEPGEAIVANHRLIVVLPALLDELERLRAELAFRDAPDEPLSAGEIDSIVKRVLAEHLK